MEKYIDYYGFTTYHKPMSRKELLENMKKALSNFDKGEEVRRREKETSKQNKC